MAPELYSEESYNNKCDVWSIGCIVYELCTFNPPFIANNQFALFNKILY
jgi:NIMA (never in mitosis gene a)-related kinase